MRWWPFGKKREEAQPQNDVSSSSYSLLDAERWAEFFQGSQTYAGQIVNPDTAMRASAVFSCVRLISAAVACAPVKVYRRKGDLRERREQHPLAKMLRIRPNRFMTAATFWKALMMDKLLRGNAYAHIIRRGGGQPIALMPLKAAHVAVYYAWELGLDQSVGAERNRLFYAVSFDDGGYQVLDQDDVLHVPNVGWNGKYGISTISAMAQTVGLALGAEQSSAMFFENGMQPSISITIPTSPSEDAKARFREHLKERFGGASNHHKPLVLFDGGKAEPLSMTAEDAQLLESRKFSVIDICRFFGVHPVMIGENEKTSSFGGGIEQMGRWFNTLTLNEHFTAYEQEMETKLFVDGCFAEFDESEITRGDTQARANYYNIMRGSLTQPQLLTVNEMRAAEGFAPIPGGDDLYKPEIKTAATGADNTGDQANAQ